MNSEKSEGLTMIVFTDESFIFSNYCYKPRCSFFVNLGNLTPERNDITIVVKDNSFENKIIKIAVVGDPHLSENKNAFFLLLNSWKI